MASSDSQIDKPQRGRPKRAELPDVNINTGAESINIETASSGNCTAQVNQRKMTFYSLQTENHDDFHWLRTSYKAISIEIRNPERIRLG